VTAGLTEENADYAAFLGELGLEEEATTVLFSLVTAIPAFLKISFKCLK
jgi:hypothetical protein